MARVLVCGIAVVDFVFQVPQMPSQPQKYRAETMTVVGGGIAANAAVAITRLGGSARLITRLGDDEIADTIRKDLIAEGVDLSQTCVTAGAKSPISSVMVDAQGERLLINYPGANLAETIAPPDPNSFDAVLVDTRWPKAALICLTAAREAGKPGVLDAEAPVDPALVAAASHVVFSAQGLRDFAGTENIEGAIEDWTGPAWVGVTDGARGIFSNQGWTPGFDVTVVDTLGAGDVWHGAFTLALAEGQGDTEAITFAHATAALKCTAFGGRKATPSRTEVAAFLKERDG